MASPGTDHIDDQLAAIRDGHRRSLARAMTLVDRGGIGVDALTKQLRQMTRHVPWWGITGPPGVGKSSLIDRLIGALRQRERRVGVVAVDPTSPVTSGAMLGDRIRMMPHALDPDVFIRSLATHGREGGLSDATLHCARLLELARFDPVLIETVGVGQNEVDVACVVDLCVVVLGPGHGDHIQLIKAGLLEIADVVVVNKCDTPQAARVLKEVREELAAGGRRGIDVLSVSAATGEGMDQLVTHLVGMDQDARCEARAAARAQRRLRGEVSRHILRAVERQLAEELAKPASVALIDAIRGGGKTMEEVSVMLVKSLTAEIGDADV